MKQPLIACAALCAIAATTPAAAEAKSDRARLIEWGYTIAGNPDSDSGLITLGERLCLMVAADTDSFAVEIANRVLDNARDVGIRIAPGKCRTNALIVFADDAQGQLRALQEKRGRVYGSLYPVQLDRMLAAERNGFAFQLANAGSIETTTLPLPTANARSAMAGALVVIDKAAAEGLSAVQLADYATLRLLAPTSDLRALSAQPAAGQPATILTLFRDREAAPAAMTRFDRAYLESLYTLPRGTFARSIMARASRVALADTGSVEVETGTMP